MEKMKFTLSVITLGAALLLAYGSAAAMIPDDGDTWTEGVLDYWTILSGDTVTADTEIRVGSYSTYMESILATSVVRLASV